VGSTQIQDNCVAVEKQPTIKFRNQSRLNAAAVRQGENMNTKPVPSSEKTFACETCQMRKKAEANPKTLMARLWRWHTGWCPGWKAYQAHLAAQTKLQ
jgi:hypothetical protein